MRELTRVFAVLAFAAAAVSMAGGQQPASSPAPVSDQTTPAPPVVQPRTSRSILPFPTSQLPINPVATSDRLEHRVVVMRQLIAPLYRKPTKRDLSELLPSENVARRYAPLVRGDDSGVAVLTPQAGCIYSDRVVSASEECLKYSFPGAGNSFSFRTGYHRVRHLADITYAGGKLMVTGIFMHGTLTDLGEIELESVSVDSPGIDYLRRFNPAASVNEMAAIDEIIAAGHTVSGLRYAKAAEVVEGHTYALRVVAYRGKIVRSAGGVRFNELDFDKRRDAIFVFKIVEIDSEQKITLAWRKLSESESPRVKIPEVDPDSRDDEAGN